jgi:8-oxo-dGTP diphosphatase
MLRVVVGVIFNAKNEVLIAKRKPEQFKADFWEFAGGKIENNETKQQTLEREINEELGIKITNCEYKFNLIQKYPQKIVDLAVFVISQYTGKIIGKEGQEIQWVGRKNIKNYQLLPTVMPIFNRLTLAKIYNILNYDNNFWQNLEHKKHKIQMLQLRSKIDVDNKEVVKIHQVCLQNNIKLILNIPNIEENLDFCEGYHLTSEKLKNNVIYDKNKIISCATHNENEIKLANQINADIITLSPINKTTTHLDTKILGVKKARKLAQISTSLVYFLGGMQKNDISLAQKNNAFGVAGITNL